MDVKKIEKLDLDELNKVRTDYSENNIKLGMISADEYLLKQQLSEIESLKQECFDSIETIKTNEIELLNKLKEKYGEGQINIDEGTFISTSSV